MNADRVTVFIASSDNTFDVLQAVYPSVRRNWATVGAPVAVGLNKKVFVEPGVTTVAAPVAGWRKELSCQLCQLSTKYVLLLLDDFLFFRAVDKERLMGLVDLAVSEDIAYLRLIPTDGSALVRLSRALRRANSLVERIAPTQPYFSSLQAALWNREYLLRCLGRAGSIWDFEHQIDLEVGHYAVRRPVLSYRHVVEKGRWLAEAQAAFVKADIEFRAGDRDLWPKHTILLRKVQRLRFELFGYSTMRLRRLLLSKR